MAAQYFAILTNYGTQAFAKALSSNQPLRLATFAVGDGNGQAVTPTSTRTALVREKHRAAVSSVSLDPRNNKQVIVELTIPENVGGFYIREMGVFDSANKLVAYANCPESFKPTLDSGSGKIQVMRIILQVASSSAVTLSVDHSVIFVTRQQLNPKNITATTTNGFDETGHTHAIDKASLTVAGIVQLDSSTNSTAENKAATPKAVKTVKDQLDSVQRNQANYIPNSKKSNAVDSASADTVATSMAVKTVKDQLDSVQRNQANYIPNSKKSNAVNSNSADTVATSAAVKTAYDKAVDVESKAVLLAGNQGIRGYKSFSDTLESKYRMVVRRNESRYNPYMWLIDQSVDMTADSVNQKTIGEYQWRVGADDGEAKAMLKTILLADKNISFEIGGWDANKRYRYFFKSFSKTNNIAIGKAADNERDLLQVAGTIAAGTPPANAANDQVVTVEWAKSYGVSKAGDTINGQLTISNTNWGKLNFPNADGGTWRQEFNPASETDPRFNFVYVKADKTKLYCSFPRLEKNETVAYRSWVGSQIQDNFARKNLTTEDLDSIKAFGVYGQMANNNCTPARHYPVQIAGTLLVYPAPYGAKQIYIEFSTGRTHQRYLNSNLTSWSAWKRTDGIDGVNKSGDVMTGDLTVPHINVKRPHSWLNVISTENDSSGIDFSVRQDKTVQGSIELINLGNYAAEFRFHATPEGDNFSKDRRKHVMTLNHNGHIWTTGYGWLHDYFAKQSDNNNIWNELNNQVIKRADFIRTYYANHYNGTEVYKIRHLGLMITVMNATGGRELLLPEHYDGHAMVLATDRGQGHIAVNSNYMVGNNKVRVGGRGDKAVSVLVIGMKNV